MLSYLGCLWSDQILQMLGSQSVYTPALLGGNDFSATITSYSETVHFCHTGFVGGGGKSRGDGGCFILSAVTRSAVGVIILSSDVTILTAAVMYPR